MSFDQLFQTTQLIIATNLGPRSFEPKKKVLTFVKVKYDNKLFEGSLFFQPGKK